MKIDDILDLGLAGGSTLDDVLAFAGLVGAHAHMSRRKFGSDQKVGPIGSVKHLGLEVLEVLKDPDDPIEYVDIVFLVADAVRRYLAQSGLSISEFVALGREKLAVIEARNYPSPLDGEPREHIKNETERGL